MKVKIKMIELRNDEEKFARNVDVAMEKMMTEKVELSLTTDSGGNLYSAMIIKITG